MLKEQYDKIIVLLNDKTVITSVNHSETYSHFLNGYSWRFVANAKSFEVPMANILHGYFANGQLVVITDKGEDIAISFTKTVNMLDEIL